MTIRQKIISLVLVVIFAALVPVFSQTNQEKKVLTFEIVRPEKTSPSPIKPVINFDFSTELDLNSTVYKKESDKGKRGFVEIRLKPVLEISNSDSTVTALIEGDFLHDSESLSTGAVSSLNEDDNRWAVNLRQAWIEMRDKGLSLRLGKQLFDNLSVTDTVSPGDVLNPWDWTSVTDSEKIGIPSVSLFFDKEDWFAQAVVVPVFTPSKLPENRWQEDLPVGVTNYDVDWREDRVQYLVRVGGDLSGYELSAMYYNGVSFNPYGRIVGSSLNLNYSDQEVFAGSVVKELLGGIIGKAEVGFYDQEHGDDFFQYVIGARKEFDSLFGSSDILSVLIQYTNEEITSRDDSVVRVTDFRRDLNDSVLSRISYQFKEDSPWEMELEATFNLSNSDYLVRPQINYSADYWKAEFGFQKAGGPQDSLWGKYKDVDAIFLNTRWYFW